MNQLKAFDPKTGSVLWFAEGINPLVYSSPTFGQETLVVFGGFFGSGMFIFNPPWTLPAMLRECMPFLASALGQDEQAGYTLDARIA